MKNIFILFVITIGTTAANAQGVHNFDTLEHCQSVGTGEMKGLKGNSFDFKTVHEKENQETITITMHTEDLEEPVQPQVIGKVSYEEKVNQKYWDDQVHYQELGYPVLINGQKGLFFHNPVNNTVMFHNPSEKLEMFKEDGSAPYLVPAKLVVLGHMPVTLFCLYLK